MGSVDGSPPRVWGQRESASVVRSWTAVHPHGCGDNELRATLKHMNDSVHPHGCGDNGPQ